jgi:hypothetical protein
MEASSSNRMLIPTGGVMGLRPTQGDEKRLGSATTLYGAVALSFVIPKRSRGICSSFHQPPMLQLEDELSSRLSRRAVGPKRTQISYLAALATTTYAAFRRERRMKFASANKFHRKSGGA